MGTISCTQKSSQQDAGSVHEPIPSVMGTNETKPSFVDLPHLEVAPLPDAVEGGGNPIGPVEPGKGQMGLDSAATCDTYIEKYWKVGAETVEEAAGPFSTRIVFTSKVLSRSGHQVTLRTQLQTPDSSQNIDEQITFDACADGAKVAIPNAMVGCAVTPLGTEGVVLQGRSLTAHKFRIGPCSSSAGKTYDTTVWRVNEIALWGIAKREVRGSIVPSLLGGIIAAQTSRWEFGN